MPFAPQAASAGVREGLKWVGVQARAVDRTAAGRGLARAARALAYREKPNAVDPNSRALGGGDELQERGRGASTTRLK